MRVYFLTLIKKTNKYCLLQSPNYINSGINKTLKPKRDNPKKHNKYKEKKGGKICFALKNFHCHVYKLKSVRYLPYQWKEKNELQPLTLINK